MRQDISKLLPGLDLSIYKALVIVPERKNPLNMTHINFPYPKSKIKSIVTTEGLMYGMSGFSEAMRNVSYSIYKSGVNVITDPHDNKYSDNVDVTLTEKGKFIEKYSTHYFSGNKKNIRIEMTIPMGIKRRVGDDYTIAYIMFETKTMPKKYVEYLNKECDEIWTPSKFNLDGFIEAGWKKPIFVMPLGVDTDQFNPDNVKPLNRLPYFTFLSIMGWSERKGVSVLIESFCKAFTRKDNVLLRIKGGWYPEDKAIREVEEISSKYPNPPLIMTDFNIYTNDEMPRLYKSVDAFVLPSRGEGWGLNYTEAMSMGLPTIGTNATSQVDFMNDSNSYLIDIDGYKTEPRCDWVCDDYIGQLFANPSIEHLAKLMREVYDNNWTAQQKGKKARYDMVNGLTWSHSVKKYIKRLKEIDKLLN